MAGGQKRQAEPCDSLAYEPASLLINATTTIQSSHIHSQVCRLFGLAVAAAPRLEPLALDGCLYDQLSFARIHFPDRASTCTKLVLPSPSQHVFQCRCSRAFRMVSS
jgi:hypothetical protein